MAEPAAYPPERHLLRDLRLEVEHRPDGTSTAWIPLPPGARTPSGAPLLGAVATMVDALGGGMALPAALPDWIATADLTLHLLPGTAEALDSIEARGTVARSGRSTLVIEAQLFDVPGGAARGLATMTFSVIPRRVEAPVWDRDPEAVHRMTLAVPGAGLDDIHLHDALPLRVVDPAAGEAELGLDDYTRNSFGAAQGGVFGALAGASAEAALGEVCGSPVEAVDLHLTYLELGKVGPLRARATVLRASPTEGAARIEISDRGGDKVRTAWATVACAAVA